MAEPSPTKQRLLETGVAMLLERGYNDLGVAALLEATDTPKGSFYHHFESKEDFALQVVDLYMTHVHAGLDACLGDESVAPLQRIRNFFEATERAYKGEGYLGCLLGGLGQELSGVSDVFRAKKRAVRATSRSRPTAARSDSSSSTAGKEPRSARASAAIRRPSGPCSTFISPRSSAEPRLRSPTRRAISGGGLRADRSGCV